MTLMRFDPFRELDRFSQQVLSGSLRPRTMPMEAYRRGNEFSVHMDVPGIDPDDLEVTVEQNVVNVSAVRRPAHQEGDEVLVDERPQGQFTRQLLLGDNLDSTKLSADMRDGVLTLRIPVAEESKPRRVEVGAQVPEQKRVETEGERRQKTRS